MLSVVIPTHNHAHALIPTLQMLVPAALEGVVRQVIVADAGSTDRTHAVAEEAGCDIVEIGAPLGRRLRTGAAKARAPWLMFLKPGAVLEPTWVVETKRFVDRMAAQGADGPAAVFRREIVVDEFRPALGRTLALAKALFACKPTADQGLMIAKRLYDRLGGHSDNARHPEADFIARLGRRRIVRLRSGASIAGAELFDLVN